MILGFTLDSINFFHFAISKFEVEITGRGVKGTKKARSFYIFL
jgi:hypothetical protein